MFPLFVFFSASARERFLFRTTSHWMPRVPFSRSMDVPYLLFTTREQLLKFLKHVNRYYGSRTRPRSSELILIKISPDPKDFSSRIVDFHQKNQWVALFTTGLIHRPLFKILGAPHQSQAL